MQEKITKKIKKLFAVSKHQQTIEEIFSCPACKSMLHFWFIKKTEFGCFRMYRCLKCKSAFVMPRLPANQIADLYRDLENLSDDIMADKYREKYPEVLEEEHKYPIFTINGRRIATHIRALTSNKNALDVGAGLGFYSQSLVAAGFHVQALEPDAKARDIFRRMNGFDAFDGYLDAKFVKSHKATYDIVLLTQLLEHMRDPDQVAEFINYLLTPGGITVIALPQFRSWLSILSGRHDRFIIPPHHLNFFTPSGLKLLMERHGFKLVCSENVTWFNPERVICRFKFRFLGLLVVALLTAFFNTADIFNKGNFLEAYFQKIE